MITSYSVGDRVRVQDQFGTVAEVLADRRCYRLKMDDGRGMCIDEGLVLAAEEEPAPEMPEAPPAVQDKMIRGPVGKRKR